MSQSILHPKVVETATFKLTCGNKSGTAFLVTIKQDRQILITSDHNLPDGESVVLIINETEVNAEILERIAERDVAILEIQLEFIEGLTSLPLKNIQIPYNELWETYGFPAQRIDSGGRYTGKVSRVNDGTKWDVDLECNQYNKLDFAGLSGSPLIINGFVVGIIGYDNVGTVGATSIFSIAEALIKHDIEILSDKSHSIPNSIENDILNTNPNTEVLTKINSVITEHISESYFLISGSPGSGKTTIAAQLELIDKNHLIVERFFVKVPESEEYPTQIRATPEFFMKWLEEVCYRALYNNPPPKVSSETTLNERVLAIHGITQQLSNYYQEQGKIAFFVIDGLDDVNKTKIEDYLSVLPSALYAHLKIIFSCVSKESLSQSFQTLIKTSNEIKVTPLPIQNAENFLARQLAEKELSIIQINELAQKSEGHPLYLRYLIKYIIETEDLTSISNWISSIPAIGGEIENYYNKIWQQINDQTEEIWLASTLASLRIAVDKNTLSELVPASTKHNFIPSFKKISHLLRDEKGISIYHTSFSDFINGKTIEIREQVHKNIAQFILKHPHSIFSISERVYHLARGDEQNKRIAIEECNQAWIDACALNSINPDIVLADVKNIIGLAAELGIAHKVISLLLLSQRVNFRYNTLFQENALFLVNALLALNKPEEAIRYVVRNKTLITGDGDALYLLQRFYEYDAQEEAEVLLDVINQTCRNLIEAGLDNESFHRFNLLKFSSISLSSNSDFESAFEEYRRWKSAVVGTIENNGNPKETIETLKNEIGVYHIGYLIWRFNIDPITKVNEETFKIPFDEKSSGLSALYIYQALDFQEKSPKRKKVDNIPAWIKDLEYVIDKYGIHPNYRFMLLYILLGRSKRLDIIEKLYKEVYPEKLALQIREDNGVDLNHKSIHRFTLYAQCQGFFDSKNQFSELPKHGFTFDNWEENIKQVFNYISFLSGKVKRCQADGNDKEIGSLQARLDDLLKKITPDLRYRMHWKRSYALPELIYPVIYKSFIQLLIDAFPDTIPVFVEKIVQRESYQLGIYTEGYTDSLFVIARQLAKNPDYDVSAFRVAKVLEEHIINSVENREERNEYLLRLVELYALLKNEDRANSVFMEMINTSMGPAWYKEAQLGIINTAVSNIIPNGGDFSYLKKFAAHLHNASGEMTFQRYVKQQQEEFAGDLSKIGFLDKSISYFKYLLFPDYQTIISNAESSIIDMPNIGDGYSLGAKAIEEQNGILNVLQNLEYKGSLIVWGLCELFILGDDRYLHDYASIQANILNYIENNDSEKLDKIFKRTAKFVVTEVSDEYRYEYLKNLFGELSSTNFERIKGYLESVGMSPTQPTQQKNNEEDVSQTQQKEREDPLDELIKLKETVEKKLKTENRSGARKTIIEALHKVQDQKYSIWSSNFSNKINDVRNLLSETYTKSDEIIREIKDLIINEPYFEEWIIANQIIKLLRNINDEEEKQLILNAVLEHIDLMVRTQPSFYDKYDWISADQEKTSSEKQDELLLKLLIWLLNHPSLTIKNRTIEVLTWLGECMPEIIVQALVTEILSEGYKISKEISASIIHQITNLNPDGFSSILKGTIEQYEQELLKIEHFMIKNTLLDSLKELKYHGVDNLDDLITKFEQTFIVSSKSNGDIIIEEQYLEPIDDYLYELNELGILTKQFARTLIEQVDKLAPLPISECQKVNEYIDRSFNNSNDISLVSDFDTLLRYALNVAVYTCTTLENKEMVAQILRFYQPTFPENKMQVLNNSTERFEVVIKDLFETSKLDFNGILINDEIPLNYYNSKYTESGTSFEEQIEISAYLIPVDKFTLSGYSYPWPTFFENNYPDDTLNIRDGDVIPIFINSTDSGNSVTGSDLVPAGINSHAVKLIPDILSGEKSVYWRRGRNWDNRRQGVAQQTGYFTTISKNKIDTIKSDYKLILKIYRGGNYKYIDVFEQKEI